MVRDSDSYDREDGPTRKRWPLKRCVTTLGVKPRGINRPPRRHVEHADVGRSAGGKRAARQVKHLCGDCAHAREQLGECQYTALHQLGIGDAKRRLEPDDAEGRIVERGVLLVVGVRGVVGSDAVDDAFLRPARSAATSVASRNGGGVFAWTACISPATSAMAAGWWVTLSAPPPP